MISISKLPAAGLGNKLFSWAAGAVFAHLNNCDHIVLGMTKFHFGTWLRKEKSKRFYVGYFKNEKQFSISYFLKPKKVLPQIESTNKISYNGNVIFNEIPHWADWFIGIREYRLFIKDYFYKSLTTTLLEEANAIQPSEIAVHIRMGDFRELNLNEDFKKVGNTRTPHSYFIDTIQCLRNYIGHDAAVTVFSDGSNEHLNDILSLPNCFRQSNSKDILDLIGLSKSKVLITSAGSSFSKWAGFLSEGIIIDHYQHIHNPIRDKKTHSLVFEGGMIPNQKIDPSSLLGINLRKTFLVN